MVILNQAPSEVSQAQPALWGETFLCVATRTWDSLWRDSQQIMSRIAKHNRVLYFEPGRDPDRGLSEELLRNGPNYWRMTFREALPNVFVIPTPSSLPYAHRHLPRSLLQLTTPVVARLNSAILVRHIRRAMEALNVSSPILWLYEPREVDLIGKFGEKLVCYYNYDEHPQFTHNARIKDLLRRYDDELSGTADVVFATSRGQWERRKRINDDTYFVPNGVDFDLFHQALNPNTQAPPEVAALPRPVIGFVGWLGYQIDVELVARVAESVTEGSLLLVGPDRLPDDAASRRLRSLPNVHMTGQKPLGELPAYLKAIDVALIPYVIEGHTLTVYPLKLHEYLAAGRAIVASALPELAAYSHVVRIGATHEAFIRQVREAASDNGPERVEARVAVAMQNTWDRRVQDIYEILAGRLEEGRRTR